MLSVKNMGGGDSGLSLKMEIHGDMYYDTGSTSGIPMNMQKIYGYYRFVNEPKSFTCIQGYTPVTVNVTSA